MFIKKLLILTEQSMSMPLFNIARIKWNTPLSLKAELIVIRLFQNIYYHGDSTGFIGNPDDHWFFFFST